MAKNNDSLVSEFVLFLKTEKKWWLLPIMGILLLVSIILIAAQGSSVAPFIYTLF